MSDQGNAVRVMIMTWQHPLFTDDHGEEWGVEVSAPLGCVRCGGSIRVGDGVETEAGSGEFAHRGCPETPMGARADDNGHWIEAPADKDKEPRVLRANW